MARTDRPPFDRALLAPRHWPAWLGVGLMRLIATLPFCAWMTLGRMLGAAATLLRNQRRRVAARNIELCFPELEASAQRCMLDAHMRDLGIMLIEFAVGWMASARAFARIPMRIEGMQHLEAARAQGRGVLLVGGHFSHLEMCARLVSQRLPIAGMYRPMDAPVLEWVILRARLGYAEAMFNRAELRGTVRYLKSGGTLWYAPDQDMRNRQSCFVPFFGVPAATITATHHLARMSNAVVMPFFHRRLPGCGGYVLRLGAPLEQFPGADAIADTARINTLIEAMVREAPEQYLWAHKRFKTRPPGEPGVY